MTRPESVRVLHVGNHADHAGGIASVIDEYLTWHWPRSVHDAVDSYASDPRRGGWRPALRAARRLWRARSTYDVVHVHLSQGGSFVREGGLLLLASRLVPRVVTTIHGSSFPAFTRRWPRWSGFVLRRADAVLVLSPEALRSARRVGARSVHLVPNSIAPVPPASVPFADRDAFVFAGEASERKGIDVLLDAWSAVAAASSKGHLDVYGPGVAAAAARATSHGVRPRREVREAIHTALAVVLPSRAEAFPMVLLEAMAAGVPVATTDVGGIAWLVDDAEQIVDVGDADQLAALMARYLQDRAFASERGAANRARYAAAFTPEVVMGTLESVYGQVERAGGAP